MTFTPPPSDELLAAALAEDLGIAPDRILAPRVGAPSILDLDVTSSATVR